MKYLLILILILTPQLLANSVIIDLENKGRQGSAFIKNLKQISEQKITQTEKGEDSKLKYTPNSEVKFVLKETTSLSTNIASLYINTTDNKPLDYSLTLESSEDTLMPNFPEKKITADINCTYSHGKFTAITSEAKALETFTKELAFGKYVLRLGNNGKLAIGLIKGHNLIDNDKEIEQEIIAFKQLDRLAIKNIFIQEKLNDEGYLLVISEENKLITFNYSNLSSALELKKSEEVDFAALGIITEVRNIYYMEAQGYMIFLKDGFYKISKNDLDEWEPQLFETLDFEGSPVELKDIQATMIEASTTLYGCILIKNTGLIFLQITDEVNVFTTFKHSYIESIDISTVTWDALNIGVFINNKADENVTEFFAELLVDLSTSSEPNPIYLSRALISSGVVKATQNDWQGKLTMFNIDTNVYIAPRTLFRINNMPIYIYKGVDSERVSFGFLDLNDSRDDSVIMFRLIANDREQVVTLYRKPEDHERYTCKFNTKGQYLVKMVREYLGLTLDHMVLKEFNYSLNIKNPGDDEDGDDKDKKGEESNVLFIVLVSVGSVVAVAILIGVGFYIRYKRRRIEGVVVADEYQAVEQP
jgi:hypothetical protein